MMKFQSKFVKVFWMAVLVMMAMAACSPAGSSGDVEPSVDSEVDLTDTSWTLNEFGSEDDLKAVLPNTTITLQFEDGRISGSAGCNSYFGEAILSGNSLTLGAIGATEMACLEGMEQESEFLTALATVNSFTLVDGQLTLNYDGGLLVLVPATEIESTGDAELEEAKTLFVGPDLVDCVGVGPQTCMQVRESEDDDWTLFYDQIFGFEHEPGIFYELRVTETEIENPPADGSSIEVALVEIVGQSTVSATPQPLPEGNILQGTSWKLTMFGPNDTLTPVLPDSEITLNFDFSQINGSAGCNGYFAEATAENGTLSIGLIGSTLMACSEEIMQQEADFLAALAEVTSYTLADNQLTLQYEDGVLVFEANEAVEASKDVVEWETAVSLLNNGDVVEIFQTHSLDVTLTLQDGRIIKTVEPAIDDVFSAIDDCGEPCSSILMATE